MGKYIFTRKAVSDLREIWNYTFETWSEKQADKYYNELLIECKAISENPTLGRSYSAIVDGLQAAKINKHLIFYRKKAGGVIEVERILHERMDLKSKLGE